MQRAREPGRLVGKAGWEVGGQGKESQERFLSVLTRIAQRRVITDRAGPMVS